MPKKFLQNYIGTEDLFHVEFKDVSDLIKFCSELKSLNLNSETQFVAHIHINHFNELSEPLIESIALLANNGWIINNICLLTPGYNLNAFDLKKLNLELLKLRVRPYAFIIESQSHQADALSVMDSLRGWTSGLAVPHLLLKNFQGYQQVLPNYIRHSENEFYVFRNYRQIDFEYSNLPSENEPTKTGLDFA